MELKQKNFSKIIKELKQKNITKENGIKEKNVKNIKSILRG